MVAVFKDNPVIRSMEKADIEQVLEIEMASYPFPWTKGIFSDCINVGYECQVVEINSDICGYTIFTVAVNECHILNLCIAPSYRGKGLSRVLLNSLLDQAKGLDANFAYLEVRPSNYVAINLYTSVGFEEIARRRDYYPHLMGREDALMFARSID